MNLSIMLPIIISILGLIISLRVIWVTKTLSRQNQKFISQLQSESYNFYTLISDKMTLDNHIQMNTAQLLLPILTLQYSGRSDDKKLKKVLSIIDEINERMTEYRTKVFFDSGKS